MNVVRKKVCGSLNAIRPLRNLLPSEGKHQLIKTLIYPIIDCMDVVYHEFDVHGMRGEKGKIKRKKTWAHNTTPRKIKNVDINWAKNLSCCFIVKKVVSNSIYKILPIARHNFFLNFLLWTDTLSEKLFVILIEKCTVFGIFRF